MTPLPDHEEKLERIIHQTLRDLPLRRAPESLPERVLAELHRRAALPWWRKSFAHWPFAARAGFIMVCAGLVKAAFMLSVWAMAGFDQGQFRELFAPHFSWMENGLVVVNAIAGFFEILGRNIPSVWLYAGLAFFGAAYFALFGLGAAAYKALQVRR
jgi:hypothetical protein